MASLVQEPTFKAGKGLFGEGRAGFYELDSVREGLVISKIRIMISKIWENNHKYLNVQNSILEL